MKLQTEKQVEKLFNQVVKDLGGKSFKFVSPQHRGVPDRIAFFPGGLVVLAEMKKPGGQLTPLQAKLMREFQALETPYVVIDGKEAMDDFKDTIAMALEEK